MNYYVNFDNNLNKIFVVRAVWFGKAPETEEMVNVGEFELISFVCDETCNPLSEHSITMARQKLESILQEEW